MLTLEQLNEIPLIDTHCHRFHPDRPVDFGQAGGGCVPGPGQEWHSRNTILFNLICDYIRTCFDLPSEFGREEIETFRSQTYRDDPAGYSRKLFEGQNVERFLMEIGSPLGAPLYSEEEIAFFDSVIPKEKQANVVRYERTMDTLMPEKLPFGQFMKRFEEDYRGDIEKYHAVGLKSCAQYYGGLNVGIFERSEAENAYEHLISDNAQKGDMQILDNYLLMQSVELAAEYDIPIQIHTGAGSAMYSNYLTQDPVHLYRFLMDKRVFNRVKIVLLHGGHPFEEDTSYLVSQFANVYTDYSGTIWFGCLNAAAGLRRLMERAPFSKIMYGSDGVMIPEFGAFAPRFFRQTLMKTLNSIENDGFLPVTGSSEIACMIMHDNALECYSKL